MSQRKSLKLKNENRGERREGEEAKQKHDDGLEEEGKEVGVRFWLENTQSMRE